MDTILTIGLIPSIFLVAAAITAAFLMSQESSIERVRFTIYSLIFAFAFGFVGLFGLNHTMSLQTAFMAIQGIFLVFGILHLLYFYKTNEWATRESFLPEFLFTMYISLLGGAFFSLVFGLFNKEGYTLLFTSALIFFNIPYLVLKAFDLSIAIPAKEYKKWYYPLDKELPDIESYDLEKIVIIALEFQRKVEDAFSSSRIKAPLRMELGDYFQYFIYNYNDRNPEEAIQYLDDEKQPHGWVFYIQQPWYKGNLFLDPQETLNDNQIRENDTIIAERV